MCHTYLVPAYRRPSLRYCVNAYLKFYFQTFALYIRSKNCKGTKLRDIIKTE